MTYLWNVSASIAESHGCSIINIAWPIGRKLLCNTCNTVLQVSVVDIPVYDPLFHQDTCYRREYFHEYRCTVQTLSRSHTTQRSMVEMTYAVTVAWNKQMWNRNFGRTSKQYFPYFKTVKMQARSLCACDHMERASENWVWLYI